MLRLYSLHFFIFLTVFGSLSSCAEISYDSSALANLKPDQKTYDFSSNNPIFPKILNEIEALKKQFPTKKSINFKHLNAQEIAPMTYKFLYSTTKKLVNKARMPLPEILISMNEKELYNAAAQTTIITTTTQYSNQHGKLSTKVQETHTSQLIIDHQTLLLCLWRKESSNYLSAVIAHELGHFYHNHNYTEHCTTHELEADTFATTILDDPRILKPALELLTLAKTLYTSLEQQTNRSIIETYEVCGAVKKISNKIMLDHNNLGSLSTATSHTYIQSVIDPAIKKAFKKSTLKTYKYNEQELLDLLYEQISTACFAPSQLIHDPALFSISCKDLEARHYAHTSSKTHPPLGERLDNIMRLLGTA